jgi:hypothetical protein
MADREREGRDASPSAAVTSARAAMLIRPVIVPSPVTNPDRGSHHGH